jgi:DNA polymerase III epsilon subunit-like protein
MQGNIMRAAIIDCESTGVSHRDEAIAISVTVLDVDAKGNATRLASWSGKQYPSVPIHPAASRVHGMTRESLIGLAFDVAGLRATVANVDCFIAHNSAFDARMLGKVAPSFLDAEWRCSYRQWVWPKLTNKKLDTVCQHFQVNRPAVHESAADVDALIGVLLQRTGKTERSMTYLGKLLAAKPFSVKGQIANDQWRDRRRAAFAKDNAIQPKTVFLIVAAVLVVVLLYIQKH